MANAIKQNLVVDGKQNDVQIYVPHMRVLQMSQHLVYSLIIIQKHNWNCVVCMNQKVDNNTVMTSLRKAKPISKQHSKYSHYSSNSRHGVSKTAKKAPNFCSDSESESSSQMSEDIGSLDSLLEPPYDDLQSGSNGSDLNWDESSLPVEGEFKFQTNNVDEMEDQDIKEFLEAQIPDLYSESESSNSSSRGLNSQTQQNQKFPESISSSFLRPSDLGFEFPLPKQSPLQTPESPIYSPSNQIFQMEEEEAFDEEDNEEELMIHDQSFSCGSSNYNQMPPYFFMGRYQKNQYFQKLNANYLSELDAKGGKGSSAKPSFKNSISSSPNRFASSKGKGKSVNLYFAADANDRTSDDSQKSDFEEKPAPTAKARKITFDEVVCHMPFNKDLEPVAIQETLELYGHLDDSSILEEEYSADQSSSFGVINVKAAMAQFSQQPENKSSLNGQIGRDRSQNTVENANQNWCANFQSVSEQNLAEEPRDQQPHEDMKLAYRKTTDEEQEVNA